MFCQIRRLLAALLAIERAMGRTRVAADRWASRSIDLDVLLIDDLVIDTPALTVPRASRTVANL